LLLFLREIKRFLKRIIRAVVHQKAKQYGLCGKPAVRERYEHCRPLSNVRPIPKLMRYRLTGKPTLVANVRANASG
jgi:hypothetical protein